MSMPAFLKVSVLGKWYLGLVLESIALSGEKLKTALRDICNLHELFFAELITMVIIIYWPLATNSQRLAWVCLSCRRWLHWCFNCSVSNNKNVKEFKQAVHWASNGNVCLLRKAPWIIEHRIVLWDIGWETCSGGRGQPGTSALLHSMVHANLPIFGGSSLAYFSDLRFPVPGEGSGFPLSPCCGSCFCLNAELITGSTHKVVFVCFKNIYSFILFK